MKILLGHTFPDRPAFGALWVENWLARLRSAGIDVSPFSLVIDQRRPVIYFDELDALWRHQDRRLLSMYERLSYAAMECDVFICFNGANVHPRFVDSLNCFTVYGCFDDPEASHKLSKPVAAAFDLAMVGNIAEIETYKSWGVRQVCWWPLGFRYDDFDRSLTERSILESPREIEVALLCERTTRYRKERVDKFAVAFPQGAYYGVGWPSGFLAEKERIPLLQRTRIGINIHNSTGPINFRTFYLPANGVMQICDNKSHLGNIFEIGSEVIGYDSIEEAIDLTHYYIKHDDERRCIAARGWKKVIKDYNEVECFKRVISAVNELKSDQNFLHYHDQAQIVTYRSGGVVRNLFDRCCLASWRLKNLLRSKIAAPVKQYILRLF